LLLFPERERKDMFSYISSKTLKRKQNYFFFRLSGKNKTKRENRFAMVPWKREKTKGKIMSL